MSGNVPALNRCIPIPLSGNWFSCRTTPSSRENPMRASFTRFGPKTCVSVRLMIRLLKSCVVPNPGTFAAGSDWNAGCAEIIDLNISRLFAVNWWSPLAMYWFSSYRAGIDTA